MSVHRWVNMFGRVLIEVDMYIFKRRLKCHMRSYYRKERRNGKAKA